MIPETPSQPNSWARYLEPGAILTVMIGGTYLIGWMYSNSFFTRLGVHHDSLELSTTYYLKQSVLPIASIWGFLVFVLARGRERPTSRTDAFAKNSLAVGVMFFIAFTIFSKALDKTTVSIAVLFLAAIAGVVIVLSVQRKTIAFVWSSGSSLTRVVILLALYFTLILMADLLGKTNAKTFIEARSPQSVAIDLTLKDATMNPFDGKELLLILHNGGRYYVTEHQAPAPPNPIVYIIPDDAVKYAALRKPK